MRALPVQPMAGTPGCVVGVSIIRGMAVPVVDASTLLGGVPGRPGWLVVLKVGARRVALAVDGALGLRPLGAAEAQQLPPLLRNAESAMVASVAALDAALIVTLDAVRLLPDSVLAAFEAEALAS